MWASLCQAERIKVILVACLMGLVVLTWSAENTLAMLRPVKRVERAYFDNLRLKTGDLLLWSYKLHLRTDIEKLLCGSQYTHVSIVFMDRCGIPYAWETVGKTGNRLVRLEAELTDPRYQCVVRAINKEVDPRLFEAFVRTAYGGKYSFGFWQGLLYKWTPYLTPPVKNKEQMLAPRFCSELVSYTYERLGVMNFTSVGQFHALMMPGDFSETGETCRPLPTTNGYSFATETCLKYRFLPYGG